MVQRLSARLLAVHMSRSAGIRIPLFGRRDGRVEDNGRLNGLIGGVGDEVDVGGGEFAADEAYDFFGVVVGGGEFEVGVSCVV